MPNGRPSALMTPTLTLWPRTEGIADGHDPVARLHLFGVAQLHFDQRVRRHLGELNQRAVGELVVSDDLRPRRWPSARRLRS
jgi:hypothetical protein